MDGDGVGIVSDEDGCIVASDGNDDEEDGEVVDVDDEDGGSPSVGVVATLSLAWVASCPVGFSVVSDGVPLS